MITLTLKRFAALYWGFEYSEKHKSPFRNALFVNDESAREWLGQQGRAIEKESDVYDFCDCHMCDHCAGDPIRRYSQGRLTSRIKAMGNG